MEINIFGCKDTTLYLANYLKNTFSIKLISDNRGSFYLKDYNNLNLTKIPSSPLIKKGKQDALYFQNWRFDY